LRNYRWQTISLFILVSMFGIECSKENVLAPDVNAPSYIGDLSVVSTTNGSATLTWTAPGDDGDQGRAAHYDVRYATVPITDENWEFALQAVGEPSPLAVGETELFTVRGLEPGVDYFFAVQAADEVHNWSGLSNLEGVRTALYRNGEGTWQVPHDTGTIQEAIDVASPGDTVLVSSGTYYEHNIHMKSGIVLMSETGEADCVIIDAEQAGRVMYCQDIDETTVIRGFTFTNGDLDRMMNGAGLYCDSSSPQIINCAFTGNKATGHGGGIQCTFQSSPRIVNCTFTGNEAKGHGGGISCMYASSPRIDGCTFTDNNVRCHGGAISIITSSAPELIDCIFTDNSAMGEGGAISCTSGASPTIIRCTFGGNSTHGMGGAIGCSSDATPNLSYCVFARNVSNHGAAMSFSSSSPVITNCTFAHNVANLGAVLLSDASFAEIRNTIIAYNTGSTVRILDGAPPLFYCSDIFGNSEGDWTGCIEFQSGLEDNFSADPQFCGEGYPDESYGLKDSSPCAPANSPSNELVGALPVACTGSLQYK